MSTPTKRQLDATVRGHVQGVSFRYYTQQRATQLGLVGWVANKPDGTVRVVAEGEEAALDELLSFLRQGPPAARVDSVQVNRLPASGKWEQFRIQQL